LGGCGDRGVELGHCERDGLSVIKGSSSNNNTKVRRMIRRESRRWWGMVWLVKLSMVVGITAAYHLRAKDWSGYQDVGAVELPGQNIESKGASHISLASYSNSGGGDENEGAGT